MLIEEKIWDFFTPSLKGLCYILDPLTPFPTDKHMNALKGVTKETGNYGNLD